MSKGKWVHVRVHNEGCCGGPGCILMLITLPLWPIIGGFAAIKGNTQKDTHVDSVDMDEKHDIIEISEENVRQ